MLAHGASPTLENTDDKESLFWTALDVCTKGGIRRQGKRNLRKLFKNGNSPTQKSIQVEKQTKGVIFDTRRSLIADLMLDESYITRGILKDCGKDALVFLREQLSSVKKIYKVT